MKLHNHLLTSTLARTGGQPRMMLRPAGPTWWPDSPGILKAFRRRWLLALAIGAVLATSTVLAAWHIIPNRYTAFAQLRVAFTPPYMVFKTADIPTDSRADAVSYQRTQAALIKSRFVLASALRVPGIAQLSCVHCQTDPLSWLEEELKVEYQENSEILRISLTGEHPGETAALVNAVKDAYLQEVINKEGERRGKRYAELEAIYNKLDASIRAKRSDLDKLTNAVGAPDPAAQAARQQVWLSHHNELQKEHLRNQSEVHRATLAEAAYKNRLQGLDTQELSTIEIENYLRQDTTVLEHTAQVAKLQLKVRHYADLVVSPDDPTLVRARRELATAEELLETRRKKLRGDYLTAVRDKSRTDLQAMISDLQGHLGALRQQELLIREQLDKHANPIEKPGASTDLEYLQADLKQLAKVAARIADERDALRVELDSPPRVQELHSADIPQKMEYRRKLILTTGLGIVTFLLGALSVCWLEFLGHRVDAPDEITNVIGLRVVGSLPPLPNQVNQPNRLESALHTSARNRFYNSIDEIRTLLMREMGSNGFRILLVSSAVAGEGKTTLASQLAASLARAGKRTLLVDYDLHQPSLHGLFAMPLGPGISELVCNHAYLNETIHPTPTDGLWVLPAGHATKDVARSLAQGNFAHSLQLLRNEFEAIIIDSCPILDSINAQLICQHVDGVVLSVLRHSSRLHYVSAACERLTLLGANVLGAIFAGEREKAALLA